MRLLHIGLSTGENGLTKALRKVSTEYAEIPTSAPDLNHQISSTIDSFQPECIWIQIQDKGLTDEILQKLHDCQAVVINWTGDVRKPIPDFYFHYGKFVDVTAFSNMHDVEVFNRLGYPVEFLQIGYDPEIYCPEGYKQIAGQRDIVFQANNHSGFPLSQFRRDMVYFLQQTYGDRFGVYGMNWDNPAGNSYGNQDAEAFIYRSAKIAINCSNFNYSRYSSDRLFRAMGTGAVVASHHYKDIHKDFKCGVELATWGNFDELKGVIDELLNEPELYRNMQMQGLWRVKNNFTFDVMAENIKEIYEAYRRDK